MKNTLAILYCMLLLVACNAVPPTDPSKSVGGTERNEITSPLEDEQNAMPYTNNAADISKLDKVLIALEQELGIINGFQTKVLSVNDLTKTDYVNNNSAVKGDEFNEWVKYKYSPSKNNYIEIEYNEKMNGTEVVVLFQGAVIYQTEMAPQIDGGDLDVVAYWVSDELIALGLNARQDPSNYNAAFYSVVTHEIKKLEYPEFIVPLVDGKKTDSPRYEKSTFPINSVSPSAQYMLSMLMQDSGYVVYIFDIIHENWKQVYGGFVPFQKLGFPMKAYWISNESVWFSIRNEPRTGCEEYENRDAGYLTFEYNVKLQQLTQIYDGESWGAFADYIICRSNDDKNSISLYAVDLKRDLLYIPTDTNILVSITTDYQYVYFCINENLIIYDAANLTKYILSVPALDCNNIDYEAGALHITVGQDKYTLKI